MAKTVAALAGVAEAATEQFLKGRVDPLLAIPDLMDLARGEVAGPGQVDPASVRGLPRVDALGPGDRAVPGFRRAPART